MKKFRVHFSIGGVKKSVTVKKEIADKAIEHVQGTHTKICMY